jgi:hypothetical protein
MRYTIEGQSRASGLGNRHAAAENLLLNLARSGVVLKKVQLIPGGWGGGVLIIYTVSGTKGEVEVFRRSVEG